MLYIHIGRHAEGYPGATEIEPEFIEPATDESLPGSEELTEAEVADRARLARGAYQWAEAERWQRIQIEWRRRQAAPFLPSLQPDAGAQPAPGSGDMELEHQGHSSLRALAIALGELGDILREQGKPECVTAYEEGYELALLIDDKAGAALIAFNLGRAYQDVPALYDFDQAGRWYQHGLELGDEHGLPTRSQGLVALGDIAYARFQASPTSGRAAQASWRHFNAAVSFYQQALQWLPSQAVAELAVHYHRLGNLFGIVGDMDRAVAHYREAIRYFETAGAVDLAGLTRFTVALIFASASRLNEALFYARAAQRNFETCGEQAAEENHRTQRLSLWLEGKMKRRSEDAADFSATASVSSLFTPEVGAHAN